MPDRSGADQENSEAQASSGDQGSWEDQESSEDQGSSEEQGSWEDH